jgi:hypothetical protein
VHGIELNLSRTNTFCRRSDSPIGALHEYSMRAETWRVVTSDARQRSWLACTPQSFVVLGHMKQPPRQNPGEYRDGMGTCSTKAGDLIGNGCYPEFQTYVVDQRLSSGWIELPVLAFSSRLVRAVDESLSCTSATSNYLTLCFKVRLQTIASTGPL